MRYAAYHLDESGYKTWPALLYIMGETEPRKPGEIVEDHNGHRYVIDYLI